MGMVFVIELLGIITGLRESARVQKDRQRRKDLGLPISKALQPEARLLLILGLLALLVASYAWL